MDQQTYCPNGHPLAQGSKFCPECGALAMTAAIPSPEAPTVAPMLPDGAGSDPAPPVPVPPATPPSGDGPTSRGWSRRKLSVVGGVSVLAIAAVVVGIVVVTGGQDDAPAFALTEPPAQTAVETATATCYDDYTWAVGQMADNGDSGILTVANAWGTDDGRLEQANQFLSDFNAERTRTDDQSALNALIQQVYKYCADLNGLVPPS